MNQGAWITLLTVLCVLGLMTFSRYAPVLILLGGVTLLLLTGVLDAPQALAGLSNEGVATIALLFVVAAGLRETGGLNLLTDRILGRPKTLATAQLRIMAPVAVMSGVINNTPLVAMMMPQVSDWARSLRLSVSKLMLPLSYASILGGACTLIGTSTNLIVNGWLIENTQLQPLGMFEMAWVGLPVAVVGFLYIMTIGRWFLPDRRPPIALTDDPREYTIEMIVESGSPLSGKTIEQAGLRHLPGLYLMEIDRAGEILAAVSSNVLLRENDRLVLVGVLESVIDLQKIRGLEPATNQVHKIDQQRTNRILVEAVVSDTCPLAGQTIREGRFRTKYNAVVIAVARNGQRLPGKLGDIRLQAGDTLLLEARASFEAQQRNSRDFYLVSHVVGAKPIHHERAPMALLILALMIAAVALGGVSMLTAAAVAAGLMIVTGCCRGTTAQSAIDLQVLLVIAAALGLGKALETSGLDDILAAHLIKLVGNQPHLGLAMVVGVTTVLAGSVTGKAAAVLVLPIAQMLAAQLKVEFMPFAMAVLIAAATTLATPIGYPTNMMVMGPGGYRFKDYLLLGGPLSVLIGVVAVVLIPLVWPF